MSINSYLDNLADKLVLSENEKGSIKTSIDTLSQRLNSYFYGYGDLEEHFIFGSYTRRTILPRKIDEDSDIDYMVVFNNDNNYKPQTFLDRLKRFAEERYYSSEIHQSSPTMVLELNHIKFELVPAYKSYGTYYISDGNGNWLATYPNDFNDKLTNANNNNSYKIKPVVRLIKEWNVQNNYHKLKSYDIEKKIAYNMEYSYLYCNSYIDYVNEAFNKIKEITYDYDINHRIENAKQYIENAKEYERNNQPYSAEQEIKKVFPEF